jgi:predicted NAD/FAD-binding protein
MKVAVVGSGVAGLTVAAALHPNHEITVYESAPWVGGHTNTVDVEEDGRALAVDTGFIVFNEWTYPNFIAMLERLGVGRQDSNMSFSLQDERTGLEYNGTNVNSLFAQRRNLFRPSFLRMIVEILRFNRESPRFLATGDATTTLGEFLEDGRYSRPFVEQYVVPMGRAIWSAEEQGLLGFPARFFIEFFQKHGFLNIDDRPQWYAVTGGSREYVRALTAPFRDRLRTNTPVTGVLRAADGVQVRTADGHVAHHDAVVLACHSDQALRMLDDASAEERTILGAFPYQKNVATLHTDASLLPRRPLARAAWNYHLRVDAHVGCAVTYDMNVLQSLQARRRYLVSLNLEDRIDPATTLATFEYDHPVYTPAGFAAQQRHDEISGVRRTFYCGAYWRYGFHEDGVVSGLKVVEQFDRWARETADGDAQRALQRVG